MCITSTLAPPKLTCRPRGGASFKTHHQRGADRLASLRLLRPRLQRCKLGERHAPVDVPPLSALLDAGGVLVELVANLADDLLEDVLRDDALVPPYSSTTTANGRVRLLHRCKTSTSPWLSGTKSASRRSDCKSGRADASVSKDQIFA